MAEEHPLFAVKKEGDTYTLYTLGYPLSCHLTDTGAVLEAARLIDEAVTVFHGLSHDEAVVRHITNLVNAAEHGDLDFENINWEV